MSDPILRPRARPEGFDATVAEAKAPPAQEGVGDAPRIATETVALPRSGPMLLGTFGKADALQALIRDPNGRVSTLSTGDRLGRLRIAAINDGEIVLTGEGGTRRLTLPEA